MKPIRSSRERAFTLVEMLVAMAVLGIVMTLAAMEFQYVVSEHLFIESHMTAEQQARVAMAKISGAAHQMSVDVSQQTDPLASPTPAVIQPQTTPGPILQFTQAASLDQKYLPIQNGVPAPCYNKVTIAWSQTDSATVGEIVESITGADGACNPAPPSEPLILARNVKNFSVEPANGSATAYRIDVMIYDDEDHQIDVRAGATYELSTVITPTVFGKAL